MPFPTAPASLKTPGPAALPGTFSQTLRGTALPGQTVLFPTDGSVINLPGSWDVTQGLPTAAQRAIFIVEAASGDTTPVIARFWQDGTFPTVGGGMPIYDGAPIEIVGNANLLNTRLISADGQAHTINVQFFSDQV